MALKGRRHSPRTRAAALQSELRTDQSNSNSSSSSDFTQQTSEFDDNQQNNRRKRNDYSAGERRGERRVDQSRNGTHANAEAGKDEY